jgi:hypothetical protein
MEPEVTTSSLSMLCRDSDFSSNFLSLVIVVCESSSTMRPVGKLPASLLLPLTISESLTSSPLDPYSLFVYDSLKSSQLVQESLKSEASEFSECEP